ncbi:MAG: gamma-butyrobetaine hydroxylase-like domain-containing protein [Limnobacter sp.]|uniref:gamma-butyrobetaine hydroxylase-like domain-containing protein n=1 Tax=Limnobacter sp. TaxID=2003368 RepID=UPI0032EE373C
MTMVNNTAAIQPVAVTDQRASQLLRIEWADGVVSELPHGLLRRNCKCAECVAAQRAGQPVAQGSAITGIEIVGEHALNFKFADGHERGIFPWAYLRELGVAS